VVSVPVTVNDGQLNIQFVHGVDNPKVSAIEVLSASGTPTISNIPDQGTTLNTATAAIPFTINDADTPVNNLTLSKGTSNPTLVPANNIVFGGSGSSRTVTVTPAANQTGNATITVTVSDGSKSASDTFVLTVNAVGTGTVTASFNNPAAITIPDQGAATPYPSVITVTGLGGTINNVTVTLRNLSQTWASDVDVLLVGPAGQKVVVKSDAGNGNANNVTLTLSDAATAALPASGLVSGTFRPTNLSDASPGGDNYPSPAPAGPYAATLSAFNGQTATGTWSLYVFDDGPGDQGSFAGGWGLTITTAGAAARSSVSIPEPPRITSIIIGDQGAVRVTVSGEVGLSYALETSSDLLNWTKAEVLENLTGSIVFNEQPTNAIRFYRAVSTPE
jgi:subtilisin-like proprotein convertase family protein